ncbi:hypothetical protein HanLR1_Chr14g0533901 [Helianthus annuus]|nr:hypothetical protein HanHA89_Chr14g0571501 [Helianthus annuus]KAJ0656276.1 hypothetical protein HanLR1_Chr14g0533901 [Helianthus annuus]
MWGFQRPSYDDVIRGLQRLRYDDIVALYIDWPLVFYFELP